MKTRSLHRLLRRLPVTLFCALPLLFACAPSGAAADVPSAVQAKPNLATAVPTATPVATPLVTPTPSPSPTPYIGPPEGYELRFFDEFDAEEIDEAQWGFEIGPWPYNNELECYTRDNAWTEDGALVVEARLEPSADCDYTSARLTTQGQFDFTYGYLEVRAALPTGRGTWSAIWMLPTDQRYGGYLQSGEIDIAERVGYDAKRVHSTIHTYLNNSVNDSAITAYSRLTRKDDGFHTYGMLWTENEIKITIDGVEALLYPKPESATSDSWPFDVPFHLILNLAVGGSWGGAKGVDPEAFPQRMYVDYVRYYALPGEAPEAP